MLRQRLFTLTVAVAVALPAAAQTRDRNRSGDMGCNDQYGGDRASFCEMREATLPGANPIDIDAGRNGGIRIRGWDRNDVLVRAKVAGWGDTDADARAIVRGVQVETTGGRVRAYGPDRSDSGNWSVSYEVQVPRAAALTLETHNGGISIADFRGTATFHAQNGGVTLTDVGGDLRGGTTNGGVTVDLSGDRWDGAGLDVETKNGGVRLTVPSNFSAELETATTHGRLNIDFPVSASGTLDRQLTTTLGAGGAKIRAVTTNGGVTVRRR
jgi:DUF4097 and DUF4098 domain-containing protein YvlB